MSAGIPPIPRGAGALAWLAGLLLGAAVVSSGLAATGNAKAGRAPQDDVDTGLGEARSLLRAGRLEEGLERLRVLTDEHPDNLKVIEIYGSGLRAAGRTDDAIQLYRAAIDRLDDDAALLVELERAYREAGELDQALGVCLEYQQSYGKRGRWVADELESLIRSDRLGPRAVGMIQKALDRRPDDADLRRLLITAYFYTGDPERALDEAGKLDHDEKARGETLFDLGRLADQKGSVEQAVLAYDRALEENPRDSLHEEVLYRKAQALRKLHRLEDCLGTYDTLLSSFPKGKFERRARMEKAEILGHELDRREEALAAYQDVLKILQPGKRASDAKLADEIRLDMADCELELERPGEAGNLYSALADSASDPDVRVQALFEVGEMYFYQGRTQEAEKTYYQLVDKYPTARWVNDALQRILLIGEASGEGSDALTAYSQAEYRRRLGQVRRAITLIDEALDAFPKSAVADDLLYARITYLLTLGEVGDARDTADRLAQSFPASALAPRGLKAVADQYVGAPGGRTEAQALYMEILLRYPDSIEAPDVRAAIQKLEEVRDS